MNSEQEKFLNENGLRILWNQISMQDYPNNTALTSIINTINTNKADKADIPNIDTTLSKSGAAADAKITGEAINNLTDLTQTQADWEQNDETAVDFIKNRTHYKAQIDFTIIENTTVEFNVTSEGETSWTGTADIKIDKEMPAPIAENHIITAIINGVEWTAPVEYNSDKDILHAMIYGEGGGSDTLDILFDQYNIEYPVLRRISITHKGETPFDHNNFTLSLYTSGASIIQIPLEYIPVDQSPNHPISRQKVVEMVNTVSERIPFSYYDLNDIPCYVKDSEKKSLAYFYFDPDSRSSISEGDWYMSQYTHFEIEGQIYPRKQYYADQYNEVRYYYCGNGALITNTGMAELEDTGEDFVIYAREENNGCSAYYAGELDGEFTLSLKGVIPEEVKELDERCIPDTIARVSEIPDPSNVYIGEQEPVDENIELWLDPTAETRQPIYPPATATIGQTIVVKAVDEKGVPTEWEAVDLASGGGSGTEKAITLFDTTITEAVKRIYYELSEAGKTCTNFLVLLYPIRHGNYAGTSHQITWRIYWNDGDNDSVKETPNLNQTASTTAMAHEWYFNSEFSLYRRNRNDESIERRGTLGAKVSGLAVDADFTELFAAGTRVVIKAWRDNL